MSDTQREAATPQTAEAQASTAAVESLSYEQAREELVHTVRTLEAGNLSLEDSLRLWERGESLADRCQSWLEGAKDRLDRARAARERTGADD